MTDTRELIDRILAAQALYAVCFPPGTTPPAVRVTDHGIITWPGGLMGERLMSLLSLNENTLQEYTPTELGEVLAKVEVLARHIVDAHLVRITIENVDKYPDGTINIGQLLKLLRADPSLIRPTGGDQ